MTYLLNDSDDQIIADLPDAFVVCEANTFIVQNEITTRDIIAAAQALIIHQLKRQSVVLNHLNLVKKLAILELSSLDTESFWVMFLDVKLRLICFEQLFQGTINKTVVHPREILKRALLLNANAVILVHNHPSGDCCPSAADLQLTQSIKTLMAQIDIEVVDHLIVGGDRTYSFAEYGDL